MLAITFGNSGTVFENNVFESILLVGWFNEHKNIVFKNNVFRGRNIALGRARLLD